VARGSLGLDRDVRIVHMQGVVVQRCFAGDPWARVTVMLMPSWLWFKLHLRLDSCALSGVLRVDMRGDETHLVILG
jgi:hypothetical protein